MSYSNNNHQEHLAWVGTAPGKLPPYCRDAEAKALGGIMFSVECQNYELLDTVPLQPEHFYVIPFQHIYRMLQKVFYSGDFIDGNGMLLAIENKLSKANATDNKFENLLDEIGGQEVLLELMGLSGIHSISETKHYIKEVSIYANRRSQIALAENIARNAFDETVENFEEVSSEHIKNYRANRIKLKKPQGNNETGIPPLPDYIQLTDEQIRESKTAGKWLDNYISFAREASPLTPCCFHIAAGLFAGSLAIARRLHVPKGIEANWIRPNLYMLFVGHSTLPRKSTALNVLRDLLKHADMLHFLLADRQTPEAFTQDLTTEIPQKFEAKSPVLRDFWLKQRAIAAQRGWLLDEASHLLDSFKRDYSSGLLPLVLDLYDSNDISSTRNTISRGYESVEKAYINIFGATTYGAMTEHTKRREHWNNGLFARFVLINSDETGEWQSWPDPKEYPAELVNHLRFIAYELLPMPKVEIVKDQFSGEKETDIVDVSPPLVSHEVEMTLGVKNHWDLYSKALSHDMLLGASKVPRDFYANYGRLATMLIKVATILATFDSTKLPVVIQEKHIYRAQMIVEDWRANLHNLMEKTTGVNEDATVEYIKSALAESGREWTRRRDLLRKLKKSWKDIEATMENLIESEIIESIPTSGRGPKSEQYRLVI